MRVIFLPRLVSGLRLDFVRLTKTFLRKVATFDLEIFFGRFPLPIPPPLSLTIYIYIYNERLITYCVILIVAFRIQRNARQSDAASEGRVHPDKR